MLVLFVNANEFQDIAMIELPMNKNLTANNLGQWHLNMIGEVSRAIDAPF